MNNDLVAEATSAQCASAATAITTHLDPEEPSLRFFSWGWVRVLHPLFLRAICTAATPTEAEQIVTNHYRTCGLVAITHVLAHPPYAISADNRAKIKHATTTLRKDVCDAVIRDLTTNRTQDQRRMSQVLTFLDYLDDEMWTQIRERIDPMLDARTITQGDLAARFVSTFSEEDINKFHRDEFEKLVPFASWRSDQFPEDDTSSLLEDTTLESLAIYAARIVRPILEAQPPETTG
ncbi:hypothetical protein Z045_25825 [Rhodococcus pyridinivorans KG-16]|uniref:Uncharacterized protein n=2 Tax=Rhodococcus pyridinivorans TaxID=103816 RepID=A0A0V9UCX4_9NOCA|nr:hypothetical protein Z045_25825 [Rhodococcus pyridinivorans KG-16]